MNSDMSFALFRRFGRLHSRLLLHKQDQLRELEEELNLLEKEDKTNQATKGSTPHQDELNQKKTSGYKKSRADILSDIEKALLEYGTLIDLAHKYEEMKKAAEGDHGLVTNRFENAAMLRQRDRNFLLHKDDLVTIRAGKDHAWLDEAVEAVLSWHARPPARPGYMGTDLKRFENSKTFGSSSGSLFGQNDSPDLYAKKLSDAILKYRSCTEISSDIDLKEMWKLYHCMRAGAGDDTFPPPDEFAQHESLEEDYLARYLDIVFTSIIEPNSLRDDDDKRWSAWRPLPEEFVMKGQPTFGVIGFPPSWFEWDVFDVSEVLGDIFFLLSEFLHLFTLLASSSFGGIISLASTTCRKAYSIIAMIAMLCYSFSIIKWLEVLNKAPCLSRRLWAYQPLLISQLHQRILS